MQTDSAYLNGLLNGRFELHCYYANPLAIEKS
jgi:hypothetical protein